MSDEIMIGLRANLYILGVTCVLIILVHTIFQWWFKRKRLTNTQLISQWDNLLKIATRVEERVVEGEPDWDSREQVYNFIQELSKKNERDIVDDVKREFNRSGKTREDVITSCEAVLSTLNGTRNTKAFDWVEVQTWSGLPPRLLVFLLAWLKTTGQVIISFVEDARAFLIEFTNDTVCSRDSLESAFVDV